MSISIGYRHKKLIVMNTKYKRNLAKALRIHFCLFIYIYIYIYKDGSSCPVTTLYGINVKVKYGRKRRLITLTLRRLMSYIYMEHPFLMFLDHTRRSTLGRTPLDEWSARCRDLYLTTHDTHNRQISMPPVGFEPKISAGEQPQASLCVISKHREWVLHIYIYIYMTLVA